MVNKTTHYLLCNKNIERKKLQVILFTDSTLGNFIYKMTHDDRIKSHIPELDAV